MIADLLTAVGLPVVADLLTAACLIASSYFFLAGTVGLLRLPDVFTRLHAITKADNVGLGLVMAAGFLQADSPHTIFKLIMIWALVMIASATVSHLIGRVALLGGITPWRKSS